MTNKWSTEFWIDLSERVVATFLGALLTVFTVTQTTPLDWSDGAVVWTVLGVPTLVSLIKGLLANLADPASGASAVPHPPGPDVEGGYALLGALGVGLIVLTILLLVLTLLKVVAISYVVLVVLFVIGVVLVLVDGRGTGRVL